MLLRSIPPLLAVAALLLLTDAAAAQTDGGRVRHADAGASAATAWSYGVYVHHLGRAKRWTGGPELVEDGSFPDFIRKIGGTPEDVPDRRAPEEEWNSAVLNVLGRQGWELVGCQLFERTGDLMYSCYLRRPVSTPATPPAGS